MKIHIIQENNLQELHWEIAAWLDKDYTLQGAVCGTYSYSAAKIIYIATMVFEK